MLKDLTLFQAWTTLLWILEHFLWAMAYVLLIVGLILSMIIRQTSEHMYLYSTASKEPLHSNRSPVVSNTAFIKTFENRHAKAVTSLSQSERLISFGSRDSALEPSENISEIAIASYENEENLADESSKVPGYKITQMKSIKPVIPSMVTDKDESLALILQSIAQEEMGLCNLVVGYDATYEKSLAVDTLLRQPNFRQVAKISSPSDLYDLGWSKTLECRGYFFLLGNPSPLLYFVSGDREPWDYGAGKYVLVGFQKSELDLVSTSEKGRKTEHIVGLIMEKPTEWSVYMNQLYWKDGAKGDAKDGATSVNRWRNSRFTSDRNIFPDKTSNLNGANITVILFEFQPHVMAMKGERGERYHSKLIGRDLLLAETLAGALNFTLIVRETEEDEYWGDKDSNGSWNGIIGSLARRESHFGMTSFFLTDNDQMTEVIDYSRFYDVEDSCFLARTEPPLPLWQSLAAPFQLATWVAVILCLVGVSPVLFFLARASQHFHADLGELQKLTYSLLYTWGMHLREPQHLLPRRTHIQIWVVFLWLYGTVLTTSYSCNLTAFLTIERPRRSIETVRELYFSKREVFAVGYFFKVSLVDSGSPYLQGLAERFRSLPSHRASYDAIEGGKGVLLETSSYLRYLVASDFTDRRGKPSARILKECYAPYGIAIALQKHFPLKRKFDKIIGRLYDTGLLGRWFVNFLEMGKKNNREDTTVGETEAGKAYQDGGGVIALSVSHMQGTYYIYLIGIALATVFFFLEVFHG